MGGSPSPEVSLVGGPDGGEASGDDGVGVNGRWVLPVPCVA